MGIGDLAHKPAQLHSRFLTVGIPFPVVPVERAFNGLDFPGLFDEFPEPCVIYPVVTVKV